MSKIDPNFLTAIIAAITSILTLFLSTLVKPFYEKHFHIFKLKTEHIYSQQKEIKEILSKNKIRLLTSCEQLNYRIWNFQNHYKEEWNFVKGEYSNIEKYYFNSFIYRFISFYSWIQKIDNEMVYMDTTIASKNDMDFIKYLRLFPLIFIDIDILFEGIEFKQDYKKDTFFKNRFEIMAGSLIIPPDVCKFNDFQNDLKKYMSNLEELCKFLDGLTPDEDRYRWDRLHLLHITLVAFLNSFGYDFQYTENKDIIRLISSPRKNRLIKNFIKLIESYKLDKQKELKNIINLIRDN